VEYEISQIDIAKKIAMTKIKRNEYKRETENDETLKIVMQYVIRGWPDKHKSDL